jgi:hypothetical protein
MRKKSPFAIELIVAAIVVFAVPSLCRAQCNGAMRGSAGMSPGMGGPGMGMGPGMGGSMAMGDGMTVAPGMGANAIMLQQQLQAMQKQMLQMQMVQQAMLQRMEEMSGRTLNVDGSARRSSVRTASHRKTSTTKHTIRRSKPKSTASSDESSTVVASERPAGSLRPASE